MSTLLTEEAEGMEDEDEVEEDLGSEMDVLCSCSSEEGEKGLDPVAPPGDDDEDIVMSKFCNKIAAEIRVDYIS